MFILDGKPHLSSSTTFLLSLFCIIFLYALGSEQEWSVLAQAFYIDVWE